MVPVQNRIQFAVAMTALFSFISCGTATEQKKEELLTQSACLSSAPKELVSNSEGTAMVFTLDPIATSLNQKLSPVSIHLDDYRSPVALHNLGGTGVLLGKFVDVRNGAKCSSGYSAYEKTQDFRYSVSDTRFQETMAYYAGDLLRSELDQAGALYPAEAVKIIAHCPVEDNAFYVRGTTKTGEVVRQVCLGDSKSTPGASYSDDAMVTMHELEHATTVEAYHPTLDMGRFFYDEAGALSEAISDFTALTYFAPEQDSSLDIRVFSRWALGMFMPNYKGIRGAHRCPAYDPGYPKCAHYSVNASGFSADLNHISYSYPDGLGWPFANNYSAPNFVRSAFTSYHGQEEIHNAGMVMTGTLFDIYEALLAGSKDSDHSRFRQMQRMIVKALALSPKPSAGSQAPLTMIEFSRQMVEAAVLLSWADSEIASLKQMLVERGLRDFTALTSDWGFAGPGGNNTPGLLIEDNPIQLEAWTMQYRGDAKQIATSLKINSKLSPGETGVIWFDVANKSHQSAAGISLTVTSQDPDVEFLGADFNIGSVNSSQAEIFYGKVNGIDIVNALDSTNVNHSVPLGNTYFMTNPFFYGTPTTGLWVKVKESATPNKKVVLRVVATPSNGQASTIDFNLDVVQ